jgi:hypothetical protein
MARHFGEAVENVEPPSMMEDLELGVVVAPLQGSKQERKEVLQLELRCYFVGRLGVDLERQDGLNG